MTITSLTRCWSSYPDNVATVIVVVVLYVEVVVVVDVVVVWR